MTGLRTLTALVAAPFCLGPVLVWVTQRSRVPRWDLPVSGGLEGLPVAIRPFYEATERGLLDLGFALARVMGERNLVPGYTSWVALYLNRSRRERAVIHAHVPASPKAVCVKPSFYYITDFTDGRFVETANSSHVTVFPAVPGKDSRQFPELQDPVLLYRIHEVRSAPFGSAPREFPVEGREAEYLSRALADFYERHVGTGYLRAVEPGRLFRPTVKGAVLMTWRLLPPLSWIAMARRARRNRAFLAEHHLLAAR